MYITNKDNYEIKFPTDLVAEDIIIFRDDKYSVIKYKQHRWAGSTLFGEYGTLYVLNKNGVRQKITMFEYYPVIVIRKQIC